MSVSREPLVLLYAFVLAVAGMVGVVIWQQHAIQRQIHEVRAAISASNQDRVEIHRELAGKIDQ
jgi:hypothetical protein